jgi:hypothetical protein
MRHNAVAVTTIRITLALLLTLSLFAPGRAATKPTPEVAALVDTFGSMSDAQFVSWLAENRPEETPVEAREQLIRTAGTDAPFTVINDRRMTERLEAKALPVLKLFGRERTIRFLIFRERAPLIKTMAGSYVAISTGLVERLTTDAELNGLVAHELTHELKKKEYFQASMRNDLEGMRRVELFCDAVAARALRMLGMNQADYRNILTSMIEFDAETLQSNSGHNEYPALSVRQQLLGELGERLKTIPVIP